MICRITSYNVCYTKLLRSFTGMGMDTFRSVVNVLYPLQIISAGSPIKDIGHAHNEFLQAALDLGIPGLIAFISIYIVAFTMLVQRNNFV